MKFINLIIVFFVFTKITSAQINENKDRMHNNKRISPDNCLVEAKLVKIKKKDNLNCKNDPCFARIKIIRVKGYGSSFPVKLTKGQKIKVKFIPSLSATGKLPGIKRKDVFEASIKAMQVFNSDKPAYSISTYKKIE
ncbi:MAG: hypothetical protein GXO47_11525 [Chlorobi bacterium]|nr:hypothetical protein [Chlorobiota bacterium]